MPLADIQVLLEARDADTLREHLDRHRSRLQRRIQETRQALKMLPAIEDWRINEGKDDVMKTAEKTHQCSFCSKWNTEVERMIAGPEGVVICNECVALCNHIIAREKAQETGSTA
jgi:hypothetical protein